MKFERKETVNRKLQSEDLRIHTGIRRKKSKKKGSKPTLFDKLKKILNKPII